MLFMEPGRLSEQKHLELELLPHMQAKQDRSTAAHVPYMASSERTVEEKSHDTLS
jgi:hypothetical protein